MGLRLGVCVLAALAITACGNPGYKGPAALNQAQKVEAGTAFGAAFVVEEALAAVIENQEKSGKAAGIADLLKICEKKEEATGDMLKGSSTVRLEGVLCPVKASKTSSWVGHKEGEELVLDSFNRVVTYSTESPLVLKISDILNYRSETTFGENEFYSRNFAFETETVGKVSGRDSISVRPLENGRFEATLSRDASFPEFQMQARGYFTIYEAPDSGNLIVEKMHLVLNGQTVAKVEFADLFPEWSFLWQEGSSAELPRKFQPYF